MVDQQDPRKRTASGKVSLKKSKDAHSLEHKWEATQNNSIVGFQDFDEGRERGLINKDNRFKYEHDGIANASAADDWLEKFYREQSNQDR